MISKLHLRIGRSPTILLRGWEVRGTVRYQCLCCSNYPFYIRAAYSPIEGCVIVTVLQGRHNCIGAAPVKRPAYSRQSWIQRVLPETIVITKNTTPKQIIHQFQLRCKKTIDAQAAKRAKHIFLADNVASHAKQYELLIAYVDAIRAADPAVGYTCPVMRLHLRFGGFSLRHQPVQRVFSTADLCM